MNNYRLHRAIDRTFKIVAIVLLIGMVAILLSLFVTLIIYEPEIIFPIFVIVTFIGAVFLYCYLTEEP